MRQQKGIAHRQSHTAHVVIARAALRIEVPSKRSAVPLAAPFAADTSIKADIRRSVATVLKDALTPGIHIFEHPVGILALAREQECIHAESRRAQVQRMIAFYVFGRLV